MTCLRALLPGDSHYPPLPTPQQESNENSNSTSEIEVGEEEHMLKTQARQLEAGKGLNERKIFCVRDNGGKQSKARRENVWTIVASL